VNLHSVHKKGKAKGEDFFDFQKSGEINCGRFLNFVQVFSFYYMKFWIGDDDSNVSDLNHDFKKVVFHFFNDRRQHTQAKVTLRTTTYW
jgi:hypothetical protein